MSTGSLARAAQFETQEAAPLPILRLFGRALPATDESEAARAAAPTARAYVYGPDTADLFERASEIVAPGDGGTALQPQMREGWRTYNFEVEDLHTYIAGGLRVHNTSIVDLVPRGADNVVFSDVEDGKFTTAEYTLPNGVKETIHGRDLNDDGNTDLVERITEVPGEARLGINSRITWTEKYNGDNTKPYETKVTAIDYGPGVIQGEEIGRTLGSALGSAIGGGSIFAQVGSATIASTILQNVGEFLQKNISFSILERQGAPVNALEAAVTDTFKDFGLDLVGNAKIQVINALSGVIIGDIADALNLEGFERGVFSTVGNTVTNQVLSNVANMLGKPIPGTVINANANLLTGFDVASMGANIANSLGGYFGSQLGNLAVQPKSPQSALFGSAAAAVGSYVGGTLAGASLAAAFSVVPVIGTLIGAFAGQALGNLVGNAFFDDDRISRYTLFTDANGKVQFGSPYTQDGASLALSQYIASTTTQAINSVYASADASIDVSRAFNPFTVGWYVNNHNQKIMYSVDTAYQSGYSVSDTQGIIASAVNYAVSHSDIGGNDVILRRAYHVSRGAGLAQLGFDLQVAKDFHKYLDNTKLINTLIADAPESAFSAGWIGTLQRAQELGLDKVSDFNAMEYLASYSDLRQAYGNDQNGVTRHMIEHGINEGRKISFNSYDYLAANPSLILTYGGTNRDAAASHYINHGIREGRATVFDGLAYIASYGNLIEKFGADEMNGQKHFIDYGVHEGRYTTFDPTYYLASNSDLQQRFNGDLNLATKHYIQHGYFEGRDAGYSVAYNNSTSVSLMHRGLLGREIGKDSLISNVNEANAGVGIKTLFSRTMNTDEYEAYSTGYTDAQFINDIYQRTYNQAAPEYVINIFLPSIRGVGGRDTLISSYFQSSNYQNSYTNLDNGRYVHDLYKNLFGREADASGHSFWTNALNNGWANRQSVANSLATSEEFANKYVRPSDGVFINQIFNNALGRSTDPQPWVNRLKSGATRVDLAYEISESPEAHMRLADQWHDWHLIPSRV